MRMHMWVSAEVRVVVARNIEREAGSYRLWAVSFDCDSCARPQTADKYQPPHLWPPHSSFTVQSLSLSLSLPSHPLRPLPFTLSFVLLLSFFSFLSFHQRLSLAERCSRRQKVGQWVSSGNNLRQAELWAELESYYSRKCSSRASATPAEVSNYR